MLSRPLNAVRWQKQGPNSHQESFFLKANDPTEPSRAFWLKFTLLQKAGHPEDCAAEVWAIRFDGERQPPCGGKIRLPLAECRLSRDGLGFHAEGQELSPGRCIGSVGPPAGGSGQSLHWDLRFNTEDQHCIFGLPSPWMYEKSFPRNKLYTPYPRTQFSGWLEAGSQRWEVEEWVGMQGHNWGPSHNPAYHWAQCCLFEDSDLVFEGYSAKLQLGPFRSPWLTGAVVRFEGEDIKFNAFSHSLNRSVSVSPGSWSFASRQGRWGLRWLVKAPEQAFAALRYFDPDGTEHHCLNSKIATCRLSLERKTAKGWRDIGCWEGKESCAYEVLTDPGEHKVAILV